MRPASGIINPPADTEAGKTAPVVYTYKFPGKRHDAVRSLDHGPSHALWPGAGARRPLLWEAEHGPKGGDELNLIEKGKITAGRWRPAHSDYNGVPRFRRPDTRPGLAKPVIYLDADHRAG